MVNLKKEVEKAKEEQTKREQERINKKKVDKPLSEFEKNIFLDKDSLQELIDKYPGGNVEKYTRLKLGNVRKNPFLFEEADKKFFFINEIADSVLIHNKNNIAKARMKEVIQNFFDKTELAEKIWEVQPYFYDTSKSWWLWNALEYRWSMVDETSILIMVKNNSVANTINSKERNEIIEAMRQYGREKEPKPIVPTWIQFQDTIVDIKTGEEIKASSDYFVTNPIPWALHKERFVNTPVMDRIFEEWVGKDYVKTLYQIIAFCLLPDYPLHRLFCFIGGGMNGKSKFLELLRIFVGDDNCCATELDTLLNSRFEITRLHKKLVCQMGETNFNEMSKTAQLKKLTGGDLIGFEYKNKDLIHEKNYAKIIIATNNLPTTTDKTIGFYRRWLIIDFPNQFSEKKDILAEIPEEEFETLGVKLLGILKDLLETKEFHNEGDIEERMKKFEEKSNFLNKFIDEYLEKEDSDFVTKGSFYKRFLGWCKENKHREISEVKLAKQMKEIGIEGDKDYIEWDNFGTLQKKQVRVWRGLRWKSSLKE